MSSYCWVQSEVVEEPEMALVRDLELRVESEAAIRIDRVKRVYGRLKECMRACSAAWITPMERWER